MVEDTDVKQCGNCGSTDLERKAGFVHGASFTCKRCCWTSYFTLNGTRLGNEPPLETVVKTPLSTRW
jgi:hypothetical protein